MLPNQTNHFWKSLDAVCWLLENCHSNKSFMTLPITVVYDMDDILWPLSGTVAKKCNIEYERLATNFRIHENKLLSSTEQKIVIEAFSDPQTFKDIKFFPGVEHILLPRELGAQVSINSNNLSAEIADLKKEQLLSAVPGLSANDLHFNVREYGVDKTFANPVTAMIDDSPYNVGNSLALMNIMPQNIAWSCNDLAQEITATKTVLWRPSLHAVNDCVYAIVKLLSLIK